MLEEIDNFMDEIISCHSIESCIPVQERFTAIVEEAMKFFKEGKIDVDIKALPLLYIFRQQKNYLRKLKIKK